MTDHSPAEPHAPPLVQFKTVGKRFGPIIAVERLSLDIQAGEFFALLGPSGCGKTTLLRMLAGFEVPSEGRILLDGADISDVPPHRRPVNMMFQSYALFPHLTVAGNIAFGLKQEGMAKERIAARVGEMLALVRLDGFGARKPHQLSGGQRQRVALARALVKRPRVLLLDEPLSALDRKLREETRFELKELQHRLGLTFIVVTHDQEEAMALADRIGVMDGGHLAQVASPQEIYQRPNSRWVAGFIGDINLIEGRVISSAAGRAVIDSGAGPVTVLDAEGAVVGASVAIAVRPEAMCIEPEAERAPAENCWPGRITEVAYLGGASICKVRLDGGMDMRATAPNVARRTPQLATGDRVWLSFPPDAAMVLRQ